MSENNTSVLQIPILKTTCAPASRTLSTARDALESALLKSQHNDYMYGVSELLEHNEKRDIKLAMLLIIRQYHASQHVILRLLRTTELPWSKIHGKILCKLLLDVLTKVAINGYFINGNDLFLMQHIPFPEVYMHKILKVSKSFAPVMRVQTFTDDELSRILLNVDTDDKVSLWFYMNSDTFIRCLGINKSVDFVCSSIIRIARHFSYIKSSAVENNQVILAEDSTEITHLFNVLSMLTGGRVSEDLVVQFFDHAVYVVIHKTLAVSHWLSILIKVIPSPMPLSLIKAIIDHADLDVQEYIWEAYSEWSSYHLSFIPALGRNSSAILNGIHKSGHPWLEISELLAVSDGVNDKPQITHGATPPPPPPPLPDSHDNDSASSSCVKNELTLRVVHGLQLSTEDGNLQRYMSLSDADVTLVATPDPERVFEQLSALFPWAERANAVVCRQLSISRIGMGYVHINPLLLVGPPGVGKTRYSKELSRILGVPMVYYGAAGSSDSMLLKGNARGWSTARPSLALETIYRYRIANPIILIDEIDKAGSGNHNGRVEDYLHSVLEPDSARNVLDECFMIPTDLSAITWVLTANHKETLSGSLLSRLTVVDVPAPPKKYHETVVRGVLNSVLDEHGINVHQLPDISDDMWAAFMKSAYRPRTVRKMVEAWVGEVGRTVSIQ